jgi:crossover junction endodeoxyribonuclease RuvC
VIALGIDPGTLHLGWGVVSRSGTRLTHHGHGVIHLDGRETIARRLTSIESELRQVLSRFEPEVGSVETLFFHKDPQAAAKLGHARGVVLLCLDRAGLSIAEYAPARVKRTIAGSGRAEKRQVAQMVRAILNLDELPASDAADALALAITHLRVGGLMEAVEAARGPNPARTLLSLVGKRRRSSTRARRPKLF